MFIVIVIAIGPYPWISGKTTTVHDGRERLTTPTGSNFRFGRVVYSVAVISWRCPPQSMNIAASNVTSLRYSDVCLASV